MKIFILKLILHKANFVTTAHLCKMFFIAKGHLNSHTRHHMKQKTNSCMWSTKGTNYTTYSLPKYLILHHIHYQTIMIAALTSTILHFCNQPTSVGTTLACAFTWKWNMTHAKHAWDNTNTDLIHSHGMHEGRSADNLKIFENATIKGFFISYNHYTVNEGRKSDYLMKNLISFMNCHKLQSYKLSCKWNCNLLKSFSDNCFRGSILQYCYQTNPEHIHMKQTCYWDIKVEFQIHTVDLKPVTQFFLNIKNEVSEQLQ